MGMQVTVLMAAYNHEKYIAKAIESVLAQTHKETKLIVMNDGSQDGTNEVLKRYPIEWIHTIKNAGRGHTRNLLLRMANTDIVCWMDADDEMRPTKIAKQVAYLESHPACWFVGTEMDSILNDRGDTEPGCHPAADYDRIKTPDDLDRFNPFGNPTMMFYRLAAQRLGGYNPALKENEDVDFWKRAVAAGYKIQCVPERLYRHRLGSHS